jgi:hypothetical protein
MAVNREAVKQVQHQHDEHQLIQPPDNAEVQHPQEAKKKRVKVLMTGVRCVALAATMAAMLILSSRKKSKFCVCGVIK